MVTQYIDYFTERLILGTSDSSKRLAADSGN